jgi:hypothetical protein
VADITQRPLADWPARIVELPIQPTAMLVVQELDEMDTKLP